PTTVAPTTVAPTTVAAGETLSPTTTSTEAPVVDREVLAGISMTSVPADVILPTNADSLDAATNPINGRRGARRSLPEDDCVTATTQTCLTATLDMLGFDVTGGSSDD